MKDRITKALAAVALLGAFALGGATLASAVDGGSASNAASNTTTAPDSNRNADRPGRQRSDETALTGETAERVRAAVLAEFQGATIERLETDGDGNAAYEAHIVKADGTPATVYVNRQFQVVGSEEGRGGGRGHGCPEPGDGNGDESEESDTSA